MECVAFPGADYRGFSEHGLGQGVDGLYGLGFLEEADDGVYQYNPEDNPRIHPFPEEGRYQDGGQEDIDQGLVELEEKPHERALSLLRREDIEAVTPPSGLHL